MNTHPNKLTDKIVPDSAEKINENRLKQLQQIARDRVYEPFEGKKSLETIQKTRSGLEKGLGHLKTATTKTKNASAQVTKWLKGSTAFQTLKNKAAATQITEQESGGTLFASVSAKLNKRVEELKSAFHTLDEATIGLQENTKKTYKELESKTREMAIDYTRKGLEVLILEDTEKWIIPKAQEILQNNTLHSFSDIQHLTTEEREKLIKELYPYNSPNFQKFIKAFDVTFNVTLGAIVATNLPGTGLLVSLINMGKTLIKLGNRLNIMAAVFGYRIQSSQALFKTCSRIIQSLEDWENSSNHQPLSPELIDELFSTPSAEEDFFQEMIASVVKKEAYIAIPGVGMISLGKINLDDLKMDLMVQHLVSNYFTQKELLNTCNKAECRQVIDDFQMIYRALKQQSILKLFIKRVEDEYEIQEGKTLGIRFKRMAGIDLALEKAHYEFDMLAKTLYIKVLPLPPSEKPKRVEKELERILVNPIVVR